MADNELDRAGQRRFVEAFTETMHVGGAGRKRVYVMAAVAAVVVSAGAAVAVGVASSHKSAASSSSARLSALAHTTSPSVGPGNAKASSAASAAVKHPAAPNASGDPAQGASVAPVVGATASGTQVSAPSKAATTAKATPTANSTAATPTANSTEATATANSTAPTTTSFKVTGQVSCESGKSVEGVWVQASDGPGYASWKGLGNGSTSDWWFTLPKDESYSLHVGCGGSTSSWAVATYSPTVTGAQNSFNCYDVADEANYGTCVSR